MSAIWMVLLGCRGPDAEPAEDTAPPPDTAPPTVEDTDADGDGWSTIIGDCDDDDPTTYPGAGEVCDGADNDCDGTVDEGVSFTAYTDADGDGFGADGSGTPACEPTSGMVTVDGDCDDTDAAVHPDATELDENTTDEDCDGVLGEAGGVSVEFVDCEGMESRFVQANEGTSRVRIVSVLAPTDGDTVAVHLDVNESTSLVLAGDTVQRWVVTAEDAANLRRVWVNSAEAPAVTAPKDVQVTSWSEATDTLLSDPVAEWDDPDARSLMFEVENRLSQTIDSFHSCHAASAVTITSGVPLDPTDGYPECDGSAITDTLDAPDLSLLEGIAGCETVRKESVVCLTTTETAISAVGLDTGAACTVLSGSDDVAATSAVWSGEDLLLCGGEHRILTRLNLTSGEKEKAYLHCTGLTVWDGSLVAYPTTSDPFFDQWRGYTFPSFADAQCSGPTDTLPDVPLESRFAAHDDTLYALWGTDDSLQHYSMPDVDLIDAVALEGVEGVLYGLSVLDEDRVVINSSGSGSLRIHSPTTGALLDEVPVADETVGLHCVTN